MLCVRRKGYRGGGVGLSWPTATTTVKAVFGGRLYPTHVITEGYDFDFHQGVDLVAASGDILLSPLTGAVIRRHYTFFGFQDAAQLDEFTQASANLVGVLGTNELVLTCARTGVDTFPTVSKIIAKTERVAPEGGDWLIELALGATISLAAGGIGIGLFNIANSEFIALEYDGAVFTRRGVGTATFTANGATTSVASKTWLRVTYTQSTGAFDWLYSTTGELGAWTSLGSELARHFTSSTTPNMIPTLYWRSGDTNASAFTIHVSQFNWTDEFLNIGRFGNWVILATPTGKVPMAHFRTLTIAQGAFISNGVPVGKAGTTGVDNVSGRIANEHGHIEYCADNIYEYTRANAINILDPSLLPRTNVSNNVSVVRSTANDPDGVDSHKLVITVTRADQDFDLNTITLTGNTTSRTLNWNTRAGLNANPDIPKQSGVYQVASAFDENSATYVITVYFNKSVVGSTFVSYLILDTAGTTLASG